MNLKPHLQLALTAVTIATLTACGGGSTSSTSTSSTSSTSAFPTGVSVASPTSLSSTTSVVAASEISPARWTHDWALAMWDAARGGRGAEMLQIASRALPFTSAWAGTDKVPEAKVASSEIEAVAKGSKTLSQIGLNLNHLFTTNAVNAGCFGPSVVYTGHDNGSPTSGTLPSGDLGMWTATDSTTSQPCAAAELNQRLDTVKKQTRQGMLMMAAMRRAVGVSSTLAMPTAGNTTDLTSLMSTAVTALASGTSINAATISLNGGGTVYTYRLVLARGTGTSAESAEIVIRHTPGASATEFTGVMALTVFQLGNDLAKGCTDQMSSGLYKTANVTTLRYDRNGSTLKFGARSGDYCGAPADGSTDHLGDVATLDVNGELDPATHLSGSSTRGSTKGWRGNFGRFGGDLDKDTQAGDFIYVWQAGNQDGAGRGFAVHADFNTSTETRTLNAYYGYTAAITGTSASTSDLLGMVCNWAGPGSSHTPNNSFQSQTMTLTSAATTWAMNPSDSKISYAPTVSCNSSSGMNFDANADGSIATGEGASVTNDLDTKGSSSTVEAELESRGYTKPTLF